MRIGFYGEFPAAWNLTDEQKAALLALERGITNGELAEAMHAALGHDESVDVDRLAQWAATRTAPASVSEQP